MWRTGELKEEGGYHAIRVEKGILNWLHQGVVAKKNLVGMYAPGVGLLGIVLRRGIKL
jgi:hypothetical protein